MSNVVATQRVKRNVFYFTSCRLVEDVGVNRSDSCVVFVRDLNDETLGGSHNGWILNRLKFDGSYDICGSMVYGLTHDFDNASVFIEAGLQL